ncbi:MAG: lmo0937 family membrane protein [Flavobacterium sp.]
MRNALYILAVILIILWAVGSFAYHVGSALIHLLLVIAFIAILVNLFKRRKRL